MCAITSAFLLGVGGSRARHGPRELQLTDRRGLSIEFSNFSSSAFSREFYWLQIPVSLLHHCHYIYSQ